MPAEIDIHRAVARAEELAKELGVTIVNVRETVTNDHFWRFKYTVFDTGAQFKRLEDLEEKWHSFGTTLEDFTSVFEILGYLRAIKELRDGVLKVEMPKVRKKRKKARKR